MAQPNAYTPATDFSDDEANAVGGRSTVRTAALDAEFSAINTTLDQVLAVIALNQRDDGEIRDGRVKLHTLAADVRALLAVGGVAASNLRGDWVTATAYVVLDVVTQGGNTYICASAHTSGTFATDLAADRWIVIAVGTGVNASSVVFAPTATLAATSVQAAIEETDTENRALTAAVRSELADVSTAGDGDAMVGWSAICDIRDGVLTRHASLAAAVTAVGSARCAIVVRDDVTMAANATIPTTATLRIENGARITTTGYTLTVNGPREFHDGQCFAGSGTVTIGGVGAIVRPQWWGAVADGSTDDTTALKAAFDCAIPSGHIVRLSGSHLVSGAISTVTEIAAGSLHVVCEGNVTITVSGSATAFTTLLSCYTTAINSASLSGGRLTLNLNNKCSNGLYLRHGGGNGGTVNLGPLTVLSAKENSAVATSENQGLLVYGRYESVYIRDCVVNGVDRTNTGGGACKGISISEIVGQCTIVAPQVSNVLCTGSSADADGISVFGYATGGTYAKREGVLNLHDPVVTDCQGRSIKLQISESAIYRPRIYRRSVVAFTAGDIDYQVGGDHALIEPHWEYRFNGATFPVPSGFYAVSWQQQCTDRPNRLRVSGGVFATEREIDRFVYQTTGASSTAGVLSVDGTKFQQIGSFATKVFSNAIVEIHAGQVQAATLSHVEVRNTRGNMSGARVLGYTDASAANTSKLSFDLVGNENTGADSSTSRVFSAISGTTITQVGGFRLADNAGFNDYLATWVFSAIALKAGCRFSYDRASSTVTSGPTISSGTYVHVEALGGLTNAIRNVRMTVDDANAANTVFYTYSGATWGTIK